MDVGTVIAAGTGIMNMDVKKSAKASAPISLSVERVDARRFQRASMTRKFPMIPRTADKRCMTSDHVDKKGFHDQPITVGISAVGMVSTSVAAEDMPCPKCSVADDLQL